MMDLSNMMELCRLCLDRDRETISIFEGEGVDRNICEKIGSCLPVKVSRDDPLPKKICDDCTNKVELVYSFWNTTSSAEKQLLEWLGLNDTDSEAPAEMLKTEMVLFKEESDENDMIAELTHMANSGLADDSQCIIENEPDAAEDSDDEESEGEESHGEEGQAEEDPGGGVSEQPKLPSINLSSMVSAVAGALNSSIEAGPSGLQLPETTSSQPAPQPPVLPQQTPDLQSIVGLDSPRYDQRGDQGTTSALTECSVCGKSGFRCSETFTCHMMQHALNLGPLQCDICYRTSPNDRALYQHRRRHIDPLSVVCEYCGKKFKTTADCKQHENIHIGDPLLKCHECEFTTYRVRYLKHHQRVHESLTCKLCAIDFQSRSDYISHIGKHKDYKPYTCEECGRSYTKLAGLRCHQKVHEPGYIPPKNVGVQCEVCGKVLATKSTLRTHMLCHSGVKAFKCHFCGKCVRSNEFLKIHVRTHTGERPFACEVCPKTFTSIEYLKLHMRTHTGEKPFACDVCDKRFTQKASLAAHKRMHSGMKPYQCEICCKAFVTGALLNQHVKKAHKEEDEEESEQSNDDDDDDNDI